MAGLAPDERVENISGTGYSSPTQLTVLKSDGSLSCEQCKRRGQANTFYGKKKKFCSLSCSKTSSSIRKAPKNALSQTAGSFNWRARLGGVDFAAGSVDSFKSAPLSEWWARNVTVGMKVEVQNFHSSASLGHVVYWVATIEQVQGYFVKLRYVGYDDATDDFWANLGSIQTSETTHQTDRSVHHVGWCAVNEKPLVPPQTIENKTSDWRSYMVEKLTGSKTLPHNFSEVVREKMRSRLEVGMKLEAVDKTRLSSLRVAIIHGIIGRRLNVRYERMEEDDEGFWFHERSPMIHPVGWARLHGHELLSTEEYARSSLMKVLSNRWEPDEASWSHITPEAVPESVISSEDGFQEGMKLEVIDPLNLSSICIGTVHKVLRNKYLMIGIDGATHPNGSDLMCYHSSSPYIFPKGFCEVNEVHLQPPHGYEGKEFNWNEYLEKTDSRAAPPDLFRRFRTSHRFRVGQYIEAVDLMDPRLICVARISRVVDRLLRIHFEGWDTTYDQWVDCDSPDIFPIGWCEMVGYLLTPPNDPSTNPEQPISSRKKRESVSRKKRRKNSKSNRIKESTGDSSLGDSIKSTSVLEPGDKMYESTTMERMKNSYTCVSLTCDELSAFFERKGLTEAARIVTLNSLTSETLRELDAVAFSNLGVPLQDSENALNIFRKHCS